jgi:hypothetical protein
VGIGFDEFVGFQSMQENRSSMDFGLVPIKEAGFMP